MKKDKMITVSIRIHKDDKKLLEEFCEKKRITISTEFRMLLNDLLIREGLKAE